MTPLQREFFCRHPADVAPDLIGKVLVRQIDSAVLSGMIVETEAYCSDDPASHTFRGKTERNKAMFGEVGRAYIYFIHGLHHCINVTARADTPAGGVLIRALEPLNGVEFMRERRKCENICDLASGPAKLTQALAIDKSLYGTDMTVSGPLFIADIAGYGEGLVIEVTSRIGISRAMDVPWRFVAKGHYCLSR